MTPDQCRVARTLLRWSIRRLAKETGLVTNTILNFETGHSVRSSTIDAIRNVFIANGVQVKPNGDVRIRKTA